MSSPREPRNHRRALPCRVADARLAIGLDDLIAIHRADGLQRNPAGQGPIGWLLDHRDAPIVDLGEWLGRRPRLARNTDTRAARVLVFAAAEGPYGLLVDGSGRPQELDDQIHPWPSLLEPASAHGLHGVLVTDDRPWLLFEPRVALEAARPTDPEDTDLKDTGPDDANPTGAESVESLPYEGAATPATDLSVADATAPPRPRGTDSRGRLLVFGTPWGESLATPVRWGLSVTQVLEVQTIPALDLVPAAPDFVRGITLWRDRPLVVLDLDRRRGAHLETPGNGHPSTPSTTASDDDRLLVVRGSDGLRVGLLTRGAPRLLRLPVPHRPLATADDDLVLASFALERENLWIPDLTRLVQPGAP